MGIKLNIKQIPQIPVSKIVDFEEEVKDSASTLIYYGVSTTAASTVEKTVSIPNVKTLEVGQTIIVCMITRQSSNRTEPGIWWETPTPAALI